MGFRNERFRVWPLGQCRAAGFGRGCKFRVYGPVGWASDFRGASVLKGTIGLYHRVPLKG